MRGIYQFASLTTSCKLQKKAEAEKKKMGTLSIGGGTKGSRSTLSVLDVGSLSGSMFSKFSGGGEEELCISLSHTHSFGVFFLVWSRLSVKLLWC